MQVKSQAKDLTGIFGYVIQRLKAGHHSVIQSLYPYLYLYLLWSVTGKTEQLVLLQAVTVGSSAVRNIIRILMTLILNVID